VGTIEADLGTDAVSAPGWGAHLDIANTRGSVVGLGGAAALAAGVRLVRLPLRVPWLVTVTFAALLALGLEFAHPVASSAPGLRAAAETALTLLALAAAFLVGDEFIHTGRLRRLLLLGALVTLATTEFVANALPAALQLHSMNGLTASQPLGQLIVGGMFAAAALAPSDRLMTGRTRRVVAMVLASLTGVAIAELGGLLLRDQLLAAARSSGLGIDRALAHPLGFAALLVSAGLFAFAAIAFARHGRFERNDIPTLLACATALLAVAGLYSLAMPSVSPEAATLREVMGLIAVALIFAAAILREIEMRSTMAQAAAISERRRVAQDLHDGLAQDLALIAAHEERITQYLGAEHPVVVAAKRALAVSRGTIGELSDTASSSAREALEAVARELENRFAIDVGVDVRLVRELPPEARDHVARIAREAIANAARHGGARHVAVTLTRTAAGNALRVRDDGCGIRDRTGVPRREGFGLRSMRGRAAALGGSFAVRDCSGGGTEIEVLLPR
jgi:signal transduction histidine kinase